MMLMPSPPGRQTLKSRGFRHPGSTAGAASVGATSPATTNAVSRRVAGAALVVMLFFIISRFTGLAREIIIGARFGTSAEYDAYLAAFRVPDLLFQLVAGGALGSAFIPVFAGYWVKQEKPAAWLLFSRVLNLVTRDCASSSKGFRDHAPREAIPSLGRLGEGGQLGLVRLDELEDPLVALRAVVVPPVPDAGDPGHGGLEGTELRVGVDELVGELERGSGGRLYHRRGRR